MKGLVAGIEATGRELDSAFQRHGIARIEAMGKPLDPHLHQAMLEVPDRRGRARHDRPGDAGRLHDQGPAAAAGLGGGGEEGLTRHRHCEAWSDAAIHASDAGRIASFARDRG